MTDATIEQQGEVKEAKGGIQKYTKLRKAVVAAVKDQPTLEWDWKMCVRFSLKIPRGLRVKPVAVADGREGGPVTLDLIKWDFNKADGRTRCRKLVENSKPLLLIGSPIGSDGGTRNGHGEFCTWHSSASCTKHNCMEVGIFFTHVRTSPKAGSSQQLWIS